MDHFKVMRHACFDELFKIAGELQGMVRSGRRPISVENYLDREAKQPASISDVVEEVVKTSGIFNKAAPKAVDLSAKTLATMGVGGLAAGAGGYHLATKANKDRQLGRQVRLQQQGY